MLAFAFYFFVCLVCRGDAGEEQHRAYLREVATVARDERPMADASSLPESVWQGR
ncbi:hypothetical protein [Mesorhizobium sp. 2RAF21]|uniref:hypothetical protein n=1 Tax=Mesorhizobium sp. 2RAF21 TaxID=3232995 RepID=UPI003F9536D7